MKRILLLLVSISSIMAEDSANLHRYMWANYKQFGGENQQAQGWYEDIFSSHAPSIYSNKGYLHLLNNKKDFKRIVELIPKLDKTFSDDVDIQMIFITALKQTNNLDTADDRLFKLSKKYKNNPEVVFNTAEAYMRRKELSNALEAIDNYLNTAPQRPNNFIFYFLKSQTYAKLNDYKKAKENIQLCLEAHPKFPQGWLLLALIEEQAGKLDQAIEGYTSYLEVSGSNKQIEQHILGLVLKQKALSQNKKVMMISRSCFEQAVMLFERSDYRGALKQINQCLIENPNDTKNKLLKVEILAAMQEFDEVISTLVAWTVDGQEPNVWLQALHLLARAKKAPRDRIIAGLEKVHHYRPQLLLPMLFLSDLYTRENRPDNALMYHKKSLNFVHTNELKTRILFQIGLLEYDNHNYTAMQEALEQAIALETDFPPALNLLAYYYATDGNQVKKAAPLIDKALTKDKNNPHFLDTKAVVLYKQGEYEKARDILKTVVQKTPQDSTVLIHLAKVYHKLGDMQQACLTIGSAEQCAITNYEKETTAALAKQWKP